ncbi:MAG: hypothetical protein V3T02_09670, partial [Alphaproteobacteria bacterium]
MSQQNDKTTPNDPDALVYKRPPQFYFLWQKDQGIPIHETFYVEDLAKVETARWDRFGVDACFVNLTDSFLVGAFVLE